MIGTCKELIIKMLELDQTKEYELKELKQKRSLDANAYYWVLINKIANVLRISKEELHLKMLGEYGVVNIAPLATTQNPQDLFKYYEEDRKGKFGNVDVIFYKVKKPSSEMDTKEMSVLIDGTVQEAKELDIETMPPNEIERLKSLWRG